MGWQAKEASAAEAGVDWVPVGQFTIPAEVVIPEEVVEVTEQVLSVPDLTTLLENRMI